MIFVRSGYGLLTLVIAPATAILTGVVASHVLTVQPGAEREFWTSIAACAGFVAGSGLNWVVGRRLNGRGPRQVLDPELRLPIRVEPRRHELYWIPMEYWSVPAFLGVSP